MTEAKNQHAKDSASNGLTPEGLEAIRKNPTMYIGDISEKGLHHLVYETVDNSINEALAGFCTHIEVTINEDNSVTVQNNGRSIPVDIHEKEGASCVNALSTHMLSQVFRDGKVYQQEYETGKPLYPVKVAGETEQHGTLLQFWPDPKIFTTTTFNFSILANRMRELAFLNAGLTITLTDMREKDEEGKPHQEVFHSELGLREFVRYQDSKRTPLIPDVIYINTERDGIPVEVAIVYNTGYSENLYSYVNNINTIKGGTHLAGFRAAITRVLKNYAEETAAKQIEKAKVDISGEDFREGLTAVISVKVTNPQLEEQTWLNNPEVTDAVDSAVGEALSNYLKEHPREARIIVDKVILAASARIAARHARMTIERLLSKH